MGLAPLLPVRDIYDVHSCANHIRQAGPGFTQGAFNVLKRLHGLAVDIPHRHDLAIRTSCRGARNVDVRSDPNRAGVTHHWFPRSAAGDIDSLTGLRHGLIPSLFAVYALPTASNWQPPVQCANKNAIQTLQEFAPSND